MKFIRRSTQKENKLMSIGHSLLSFDLNSEWLNKMFLLTFLWQLATQKFKAPKFITFLYVHGTILMDVKFY